MIRWDVLLGGVMQVGEDRMHGRRILLAHSVFRLRAQDRQRRAYLMGGIGEEALPRRDDLLDAARVLVDRLDERPDFGLDLAVVDRRDIGRRTCRDAFPHTQERTQSSLQAEPHHQRRHQYQRPFAPQLIGEDAPRQGLPCLGGLSHHDQDVAGDIRVVQRLGYRREIDRFVVIAGAVKHRLIGNCRSRRQRQVVVPRYGISAWSGDAVEDPTLDFRLEQLERDVGQIDRDLAVLDGHAIGDGAHRREQQTVVRFARGLQRRAIAEDGIRRKQRDEGDEQPGEKLLQQATRQALSREHSPGRAR